MVDEMGKTSEEAQEEELKYSKAEPCLFEFSKFFKNLKISRV